METSRYQSRHLRTFEDNYFLPQHDGSALFQVVVPRYPQAVFEMLSKRCMYVTMGKIWV